MFIIYSLPAYFETVFALNCVAEKYTVTCLRVYTVRARVQTTNLVQQ